jgi:hypothetical protein
MRFPNEWYQMHQSIAQYFPNLRPAQQRGLTFWVYGAVLAHSATQSAVVAALLTSGRANTIRQYLREWLYNGAHKAAPCKTQVQVAGCVGYCPGGRAGNWPWPLIPLCTPTSWRPWW